MGFTEAIKKGFDIVNRNWQLVIIQTGMMAASFMGFLIIVGFPLAVAFIIFGLDLTGISQLTDIFNTLRNPTEIISRYLWLVFIILLSILFYILVILAMGIFTLGGSIGIITRSIKNISDVYSLKKFAAEGRRLFYPLVGFTTLIGIIFVFVAFVLGLFGGAIAAIVSLAMEQAATLALFLGLFFSLVMFIVGMALILTTLSVIIYGAAIMTLKGVGPLRSIKDAARYLYHNSQAFYLYCAVFAGYAALSFIAIVLGYSIKLIPLIGPLMGVIYQIGIYIVQAYLGLVMITTMFCYYYFTGPGTSAENVQNSGLPPVTEPPAGNTDTSGNQAPGQEQTPHEKALTE